MALSRPFSDIREQINRVFHEIEDFGLPGMLERRPLRMADRPWMPAVDISETESEYIVKAEIPGVKPEDIDVEVTDTFVSIKAATREKRKEEKEDYYSCEIRRGQFYRKIGLPGAVETENVRADFENGILELHVPKQQESRRKRIPINSKSKSK